MLRCTCPTCHATIEVNANRAGNTAVCPGCEQRLRLPSPVGGQTVLAQPPMPQGRTTMHGVETAQVKVEEELLDVEAVDGRDDPSNRIAVGVCAIVFGWFGMHYFLLGRVKMGVVSLILGLFGIAFLLHCIPLIFVPWSFAIYDGARYLNMTDKQFALAAAHPSAEEKRREKMLWVITWVLLGLYAAGMVVYILVLAAWIALLFHA